MDVIENFEQALEQLWLLEGPCDCGVCAKCKAVMQASTTATKENKARRKMNAMTDNDKKADMGAKIVKKAIKA